MPLFRLSRHARQASPASVSALWMVAAATLLAACTTPPEEPVGPLRAETVYAVTDQAELIRFNAGQPQRVLQRLPLQGLAAGDRLEVVHFIGGG
jgi:hypothetical protein